MCVRPPGSITWATPNKQTNKQDQPLIHFLPPVYEESWSPSLAEIKG